VPGGGLEGEGGGGRVVAGDQFEQGLVDPAEFFGAEVAVVDRPGQAGVVADDGQGVDGGEQVRVGQLDGVEPADAVTVAVPVAPAAAAVEAEHVGLVHATESGQAERRLPGLGAQAAEHDPVGGPQIGVPATAHPAAGEAA
jgi:hypothetical protein